MIELNAIVVNYQTPDDLQGFLKSFSAVADELPTTITVINVSPNPEDRLAATEGVRTLGADQAYEICSVTENIGYGRACNRGAKHWWRGSSFVAFFNADVELRPGVLSGCVEALKENPTWAVCGPRQVNESNQITSAGTFGTHAAPEMRGWQEIDQGQFSDIRDDAVHVSGSAMFWRRSIWDELTECPIFRSIAPGATGAALPTSHYYDETWAMYHAAGHGYRVGYVGSVCALHKWHRASPVGGWAEQQMPESQAFFRRACEAHGLAHD